MSFSIALCDQNIRVKLYLQLAVLQVWKRVELYALLAQTYISWGRSQLNITIEVLIRKGKKNMQKYYSWDLSKQK
jgi:hypothetical protein